jgi:extracellular factor (EF) 3-hydroxypalmitic acid methyl ester biosynthesis protein
MAGSRSTASELAPAAEPRRIGRAEHGGRLIPLVATAATRLSLQVELQGGARLADGAVLEALEIEVGAGRTVRLGRSRFATEGGAERETSGRVVFLDDVYDCRSLVEDARFMDLRAYFQNVPLVVAQRERIRPEFKEHCSNLAYDLSVYKRFFDEQDRIIAEEPPDVAHAARDALLRTEGRRFLAFLDEKILELDRIVAEFTQEEHERHGFYLRRLIWPYLMAGEFLRRSNLKPRGYSGDAEMMLMAYDNAYLGTYVFNKLMHKHGVETRAAEAVRSRRRLVPGVLAEVVARFPDLPPHGFHFLSLAAGPASELHEIVRDPGDAERFAITLLDQDEFALDLARETVRRVEAERGARLSVRYVQDSVRTMVRTRDLGQTLGRQHFVYSMGLFDYLTTPVARVVLAKTWEVVRPGGTLLVGNFHAATPTRFHMAYWGDWSLCYRTEEGFLALADGLSYRSARIDFDDTGCQMFLRLEKDA